MVCCMNNIVELVIIIVWTGCSYLMATYMLRLSIVVRRSKGFHDTAGRNAHYLV